jgi:hypothetical protein
MDGSVQPHQRPFSPSTIYFDSYSVMLLAHSQYLILPYKSTTVIPANMFSPTYHTYHHTYPYPGTLYHESRNYKTHRATDAHT